MILPALLSGLIHLTSAGDEPCRPWRDAPDRQAGFDARLDDAEDDEDQRLELVTWAVQQGLFGEAQDLLEDLVIRGCEAEALHRLLGQVPDGESWVAEEQVRRPTGVPAVPVELAKLSASARKALLVGRDRAMKESSRSSWFDLVTDADERSTFYFARVLDTHFRRLKTRFRAYTGEPIHVLLFSSRSDYGRFYLENVGRGAENVLGFYVNDNLVFFDDRFDRASVTNTALHECTHLLLDRCYQRAELPIWLHEGMACYLAAGGEEAVGQYTAGLIMEVQDRLREDEAPPLERLLSLPREGFEHPQYAVAWSWVHFLNEGTRGNRFQGFLKRLRDEVPPGGGARETRSVVRSVLREELEESYLQLDSAWQHYFEDEFALKTPRQMADFALHVLQDRLPAQREREERSHCLDLAFDALGHVGRVREEEVAEDLAHARVLALLEASGLSPDTPEGLRLGLRTVRDALRSLPEGFDPAVKGQLGRRALDILRDRLVPEARSHPMDSRAALDKKFGAGRLAHVFAVLFDDLEAQALRSLAEALEADPLNALAIHEWVLLGMGHDPRLLELIYPRARLLVERDPDDSNLAMFATVYRGLGNDRWGGFLWEEAQERSVFPWLIQKWRQFQR